MNSLLFLLFVYEIPIAEKAKKNRIEGGVYMNNQERARKLAACRHLNERPFVS